MRLARLLAGIALAAGLAACGVDDEGTAGPTLGSATIVPSPTSALALIAVVSAEFSDSARAIAVHGTAADTTPWYPLGRGPDTIPILGLQAAMAHKVVVQLAGALGNFTTDTATATTAALPADLARVALAITGDTSAPGYILTATGIGQSTYILIYDHAGRLRWYRGFAEPTGGAAETKQQPNGNYTVFLGLSRGFDVAYGHFAEVSPAGEIVGDYTTPPPYYADGHELLITPGPTRAADLIHIFGYDIRTVDLTARGGPANAKVAGHALVRLRRDHGTDFFWNAWDNIALTDWIEPYAPGPVVDYDHPNSMDFDVDGNYVVSWRNTDQVTKIDRQTGRVIWKLGGVGSTFTFVNDPLNGFGGQHGARIMPNGNLLLFDNGTTHGPPESRAVEYHLDVAAHTATMVWQYRHTPALYAATRGTVTRQASGHHLICYGAISIISEIDAADARVWEATLTVDGAVGGIYRAVPIRSLYRYTTP